MIVTRPAAQAADWVARLRGHGVDAVALPLIGIAPVTDAGQLQAAWQDLPKQSLVVFVSPNAAEQFFARCPPGAAWPTAVFAGSIGPGTTRVLIGRAVPAGLVIEPASDAPQFDSESLWVQLGGHDWRGRHVMLVRGDGGREWLADTLRDAGAEVTHVTAYRRVAPRFDAADTALLHEAIRRPAAHVWFFSSSEAIDNLDASAPAGASWAEAGAIATHPRIAARARRAGFARVIEARPTLAAVIACIQSWQP